MKAKDLNMTFRKLTPLLCLIAAFAVLNGCQKKADSQQQTATVQASPETQADAFGGTTPAAELKYFRGSIGSALGLQMKLNRTGDKLSGSYFYQKIGTRIDLRGTVDQNGTVVLEEFDPNGKQTGVFRGLWLVDKDDGMISIAGNWTKPDGDKKTVFSIHQEAIEFTTPVEIVAKQIKDSNKKLKYEIDVEYPQLSGPIAPGFEKFNQYVKAQVTKDVNDFRKAMNEPVNDELETETGSDLGIGYTVAIARDDLISVQLDAGSYYRGAAHPNSSSEVINFDLVNGKPLRLSDLFKPGAKYLQIISAYAIKDLKRQSKANEGMLDDSSIESGASPEAKNYQSWTITKKGLGINFDSYQVGPYAAGPQAVLVPFSAIKDIIRPDGPIATYINLK